MRNYDVIYDGRIDALVMVPKGSANDAEGKRPKSSAKIAYEALTKGKPMLPEVKIYNEYMQEFGGDALRAAMAIVICMQGQPLAPAYTEALAALLREALAQNPPQPQRGLAVAGKPK